MTDAAIQAFIENWSRSGGAERANYVSFLKELCDVLDVPHPDPSVPEDDDNAYVFDRSVNFINPEGPPTTKFIDLYKRGCFVLETKQGVEKEDDKLLLSAAGQERAKRRKKGHGVRGSTGWNDTLLRARGQAEQYARALSAPETRPPFLVVIDVGHTIDLYSEFTQTGGTYIPFPDASSHRIRLTQLIDPDIRVRLRALWTEPLSLDPARRSAKVTREIAASLAKLARSLEAAKHDPQDVAQFLMRCLFTMFAEDVELLKPKKCFEKLLQSIEDPADFVPIVEDVWRQMNVGGFSVQFRKKLLQFNGGLFQDPSALPLTRDQLDLLIEAAGQEWSDVEPAIFGTLLERALDPVERHKLGAHYTPRAYVERLVMPTIIEPIRAEWDAVRTAAILHAQQDKRDAAVKELEAFHDRLCEIRVLDPACGSGNFLYVTLEHLKRIEGEVFSTYESIAEERQRLLEGGHTVDPHQLLGIEINPRAAAIADLVLWIGYLQWHYRTRGNVNPPEPVIKNFKNIECRDALITWTSRQPSLDNKGKPVTRWDGRTKKIDPVTGESVPNELARDISYNYVNVKKTEWPQADYVIGNPPFIGNKRMRFALGDGYVEALQKVYGEEQAKTIDFVMFWWHNAASLASSNKIKRFGFITTNSITQASNRSVLQKHLDGKKPLSIVFATKDHPWVDSEDGASVRIAMTVAQSGQSPGVLFVIQEETPNEDGGKSLVGINEQGRIHENLSVGTDATDVKALKANNSLSYMGMTLVGDFRLSRHEYEKSRQLDKHIVECAKPYVSGREVSQVHQDRFVIDFFGLDESQCRTRYPQLYQYVLQRVKPLRDENKRQSYKDKWWIFGEPRTALRRALNGLIRYVVTLETSKHRFFLFISSDVVPDHSLFAVASDDAFILGTLSSSIHLHWCSIAGSTLEDRPRWRNLTCFDPFPFPNGTELQKSRIRELGEQLDAHRKRQQTLHPTLTMTGMYNVLEKLRAGEKSEIRNQKSEIRNQKSEIRNQKSEIRNQKSPLPPRNERFTNRASSPSSNKFTTISTLRWQLPTAGRLTLTTKKSSPASSLSTTNVLKKNAAA